MIVVDAGAIFELVVGRGFEGPVVRALNDRADEVVAPEVLDLEVLQALRRLALAGTISGEGATAGAAALESMPIERIRHGLLLDRVWDLRHVCSAYDAAYIALAECFGAEGQLLTTDRRLARTVEGLGTVSVTVVPVD